MLKVALLGLSFSALLFTSCDKKEDDKTETPAPAEKSIYEVAKADTSFSILVAAIDKTGLKATLSGAGTFTVFAPNNNAFREEEITAEVINALSDPADIQLLKDVLLYHVLGSKVKSTEVTNTYVPTLFTVGGNGVSLRTASNPVLLNNETKVIAADISASNGIIHVIDLVLYPQTVVDIAVNNPAFSTLVDALTKAELVSVLEGRETSTVFAPTNTAFSNISFKLEDYTKEQLLPILTSHALADNVRSTQIKNGDKVTTLNPATQLTFNTTMGVKFNGGKVNDISVTTADIQAVNGVIHVIDKVVLPN